MANFVVLRHPVTILVTYFSNPDKLTNDLLGHGSLLVQHSYLHMDTFHSLFHSYLTAFVIEFFIPNCLNFAQIAG